MKNIYISNIHLILQIQMIKEIIISAIQNIRSETYLLWLKSRVEGGGVVCRPAAKQNPIKLIFDSKFE